MTEPKARILIVEDEETLAEVLSLNLIMEGYDAVTALSAEAALTLDLASFDLFLLDIMMGEISGMQLADILKHRPDTADIPIIFCTARDREDDMISGFDIGADDYIAKPYSVRNVLARVRAVLRRTMKGDAKDSGDDYEPDSLEFQGLVVSPSGKTCSVDGKEVKMPRKEFEILSLLLSNKGRIFTREELLSRIWPDEVVVLDRVVDVNITRLRAKLGPYSKHIVTRSGYGYGFV